MKRLLGIFAFRYIIHLLACACLLSGMSNAHAQDVMFDCITDPPPPLVDLAGVDYCKASNVQAPVIELTKFASRVYDIIGSGSLPGDITSCLYDSITNSYNCPLETGVLRAGDAPFSFNCNITFDQSQIGFASCKLSNINPDATVNFAEVMTMNCEKDPSNPNQGKCTFNLNRQPILDTMGQAANFDEMNKNENAIHDAFWTCLNRVGLNAENQSRCDKILRELMNDPTVAQEIVELIKSITPNNSDTALDMSSFNILHSLNNVIGRLNQLRGGYASNSVNIQYFDGQQWLDRRALLAANNISVNDVSPEPTRNMSEYGRLGVFVNGSAIRSEQSDGVIENAHDTDTQIATMGMDYRFTDNFVAGLALNISQSTAEYGRNSGKLDSNSQALIVYSSYYIGNWYLDANINYGQDNYEQERNVSCNPTPIICPGGFSQSFSSDFDGSQTLLSLATGYQWQLNAFSIIPFLQLNNAWITTDDYTEDPSSTGLGSGEEYALTLSEQKRDAMTARLGTNLQYAFTTNQGVIIPMLGFYGIREIEDNADTVTGHFIGNIATDGSFNLATNDIDKSYFIVAAGLNFQLKNGNAGFINIQSTEGYDNLEQIQYTAGWRWEI